MTNVVHPAYPTSNGYLTESIKQQYIAKAVAANVLPENAHRMEQIVTLSAPTDTSKPIQFWQLYSVLGQDRIVKLISRFYQKVFTDEPWFTSVFERVAGLQHHVNTQSAMWIDAMGGGLAYHGGEYRLSFHHTHNAIQLMNDKGAQRWVQLMVETLDDPSLDLTDDSRVRPAINTFLMHFFGKYAKEFGFSDDVVFGETNSPVKRRINFMNMTSDAIEALSETDLRQELEARGLDLAELGDKSALVNKALSL